MTDQLKKLLKKASDGLYQLNYDRFDVNIDSGRGLITRLKLVADTAVYDRLIAERKAPNNVLSVHIDSLIINKFGFLKTASGRRFNISAMTIKNPLIILDNKRHAYNECWEFLDWGI